MQKLGHGDRLAPILKTIASTGEGIAELADGIESHYTWLAEEGRLDQRRLDRARVQLREIALGTVRRRFAEIGDGALVDELSREVARRGTDPYTAADRLVASLEV
jgi:LAO/AO transport system kinase